MADETDLERPLSLKEHLILWWKGRKALKALKDPDEENTLLKELLEMTPKD